MSMREPSDPVLNRDQTARSGCAGGYPADVIASLAPVQRPVAESATAVPLWCVEQVICTSRVVHGHPLDGLDNGITAATTELLAKCEDRSHATASARDIGPRLPFDPVAGAGGALLWPA